MSRLANLWEESAVAAPILAPFEGGRADALVVGAGYLGLSAALHIAEAGGDVVVLDAEAPGFGASGRNGGQIIPGLNMIPTRSRRARPRARRATLALRRRNRRLCLRSVKRLGLNAEARRTAWIQGVHSLRPQISRERAPNNGADAAPMSPMSRRRKPRGWTGASAMSAPSSTDAPARCNLSPMRANSARAAIAAGARIHGASRVASLEPCDGGWRATTATGAQLTARKVLLCANAYSDELIPQLPRSIVAATSLQIATEPLPQALRQAILPGGEVLSDTRKAIRYWRLDAAGRLLMGGRGPFREPEAPSATGRI